VTIVASTGCQWRRSRLSSPPIVTQTAIPEQQTRILQESWEAYRKRFIQGDGRVIDWEAEEKSTSEGQSYAMWRAVFADDRESFDRTLKWAESNLQRRDAQGNVTDALWAWKWGKNPSDQWVLLDANFASDADIDACFALILAHQRWNRPDYLALAKTKLKDLWERSTVTHQDKTYLLPGPKIAFQQGDRLTLNPSYLAPYAFRLFAQVDPDRDWMALVESSYDILEQSASLSSEGLPSDWVNFDLKTGQYRALESANSLKTQYGFDATRVWWRVALDHAIFNEPRALKYLQKNLTPLQQRWRKDRKIPAQIDLQGNPMVNYDATSQYGMLYRALQPVDPNLAAEIYQQKLMPPYRSGFWDNDKAYYTQNLVWFGLLPPQTIAQALQGHFPPAPK
jgi:endoglucanase